MMKNICLALALALGLSVAAQAVTISVVGGGDFSPADIGTSHQLQIQVSTSPENHTFTNGGIEMKLQTSNPGVIEVTGATVLNPLVFGFANRWSVAQALATTEGVNLMQGASVNTPALNSGDASNTIGPNLFLFATVNYTITGSGYTDLVLSGFDGLNDFISSGAQVEPIIVNGFVSVVPEPGTLALGGMSLIGLVLRRRNG